MKEGDRRKLAFDFARDTAKQLITLSTAIVTLTVTFANDLRNTASDWTWLLLGLAWLAYLVSIGGGLLHLTAMTESLEPPPRRASEPPSIWAGGSLRAAWVQQIAFAVATALVIAFGIASIWDTGSQTVTSSSTVVATSSVPAPPR